MLSPVDTASVSRFSKVVAGGKIFIRKMPIDFTSLGQQVLFFYMGQALMSAGFFGIENMLFAPVVAIKHANRNWLSWYDWPSALAKGRGWSDAHRIAGGAGNAEVVARGVLGITSAASRFTMPASSIALTAVSNLDKWVPLSSWTREVAAIGVTEGPIIVTKATKLILTTAGEIAVGAGGYAGRTLGAAFGGAAEELPEGMKDTIATAFTTGTTTIALVVGSLMALAVIRAARA